MAIDAPPIDGPTAKLIIKLTKYVTAIPNKPDESPIINVSAFRLVLIKSGNKGAFIFNSPFSGKFWEEGTGFPCKADSLNLLELPNLFK